MPTPCAHRSDSIDPIDIDEPVVEESSLEIDDEIEVDEPCISGTSSSTSTLAAPPDIAHGIDEKPVQPHNTTFPKDNGRLFNASWFSKHTWLEYSISKDAVYCYACRSFSTGIQRGDECFVSTGYRNWRKATGMSGRLRKHTLSHRHINAVAAWSDYLRTQQSGTSITSTLSQARREKVHHNRHYLKTIVEFLRPY